MGLYMFPVQPLTKGSRHLELTANRRLGVPLRLQLLCEGNQVAAQRSFPHALYRPSVFEEPLHRTPLEWQGSESGPTSRGIGGNAGTNRIGAGIRARICLKQHLSIKWLEKLWAEVNDVSFGCES